MKLQSNIQYRWEDIDTLVEYLADQYLPDLDILTIAYNDKLLNKLEGGMGNLSLQAITVRVENIPHSYNIFLRKNMDSSVPIVLCHELIHVNQMERGDLDYNLTRNEYYWKGNLWNTNYGEYRDRPWEQEAFRDENKWYREYKKSLKSQTN